MSIFPEKTTQEVLAAIDPIKLLELVDYRIDTIQETHDQVKCFCPIHKEAVFRTLIIGKREKDFRCSYSLCPGNAGGSLIEFYARTKEIPEDDALEELVEKLSLAVELPPAGEVISRTIEEGDNFLYLVTADESRHDMYLEEAQKRFQKVLEVDPDNPKALKGMYHVTEFKGDAQFLTDLSKKRIDAEAKAGRHQEVAELCVKHLELEPENQEIRMKLTDALLALEREDEAVAELMALAELCETKEDYDGAVEAYRKVARLDILDIDVHPMIVNLLRAAGNDEEAVEECLIRAEFLSERGQVSEAMEMLRSALDIDGERDDVRVKLVEYGLQLGLDHERITEALRLVDEMIGRESFDSASHVLHTLCEADPSNPNLLDKLIEVNKRQGKTDEVLTLQYRLADLYRDQEDYASAILLLEEVSATTDGALDALERIAEIHRLEGDSDEAVDVYRQVVGRARDEGRLDKAIAAAERIIEIQPDDVNHRERLIDLYIQDGRNELALAKILELIEVLELIGDADRLVAQLRMALQLSPERTDLRIKLAEAYEGRGDIGAGLDERMQAADHFVQEGGFPEAVEQLDLVLAQRPDDLQALSLLAEALSWTGKTEESNALLFRLSSIHMDQEDYEKARDVLERLLTQAPEHTDGLEKLADVYTGLGDEDKVVQTLERLMAVRLHAKNWKAAQEQSRAILDLRADHIEAHRALVRIHENLNQPEEVIATLLRLAEIHRDRNEPQEERETLESVLERDEKNRSALRRLALLSVDTGDVQGSVPFIDRFVAAAGEDDAHDEAIALLRELLDRDNTNIDFHLRLIDLLTQADRPKEVVAQLQALIAIQREAGNFPDVVDLHRRVLEIEPENVDERSNLIDVLLQLERREEAIEEYLNLAHEFERQERFDDAEQVGQNILAIDPENEAAHRRLVEINRARGHNEKTTEWINRLSALQNQRGETEAAIATLREVFDFDPSSVDTHRRIIQLLTQQEDIDGAISEYKTIVELQLKAGDGQGAIDSQRQAIELRNDDVGLRRQLVRLFADQGDKDGAVQELFTLAESLREKEEFEEALSTLAEVFDLDASNMRARKLRSQVFIQTGRDKEALQELIALTDNLEDPSVLRSVNRVAPVELPEELPLVEEHTFENYVVGDRNNFAYATALATAKAPAKSYNPLFLYSDVGLGKTHLMHAIGNFIKANNPKARVLYSTSEAFLTHLIDSIEANTVNQFRQAHRNVDVLLLDDVQFLSGKERAQEEFFHIFNTLFQAKKQIVVTSDRPPKEIAHLEKRLKSRFGAGVVVDIQPPEVETRTAIVKRETQAWPELGFTPEIISLIAQKIESNVRELKGAIRQIVASQDLSGEKLSLESVTRLLEQHLERV